MVPHSFRAISSLLALATALALVGACGSDENARLGDDDLPPPRLATEESEDGLIIERLDASGDGVAEIIRYYEEFQDPRDPNRTRRRLRRMEIDVTGDELVNVRRHYDEYGNVTREENDVTLDGQMNSILYFVGGELARKEIFDTEAGVLKERRIYYEGRLVRVERDESGNGQTDRWEYYEEGILMRIGRDTVGDGSADTWQLR